MSKARDMHILDYFAAKAMAAYIARNTTSKWTAGDIAIMSYNVAEAMFEERIVAFKRR